MTENAVRSRRIAVVGEAAHDGIRERGIARRPTAAPRAVRDPSGHA